MKIIIFGTGIYYRNRKEELKKIKDAEIVTFIDNDSNKWGISLEGIQINSPDIISRVDYDVVILMSLHVKEMKKQLLNMGVDVSKIKLWEQFCAEVIHEKMKVINPIGCTEKKVKKILILSQVLDYSGGPLTAVYAALALKKVGYSVVLAASKGQKEFIEEIITNDISVVICPVIPYLQEEELNWIRDFDIVIVNVFPMIKCAYDIGFICPTLWWIHEAKNAYPTIVTRFDDLINIKKVERINTYAVSKIAQNNFNEYFPYKISNILNYGIPDMNLKSVSEKNKKPQIIFALIGYVYKLKAQDIFIKAIEEMNYGESAEFWIIGNMEDNEYCNSIREAAEQNPSIKIKGVLTREEIYNVFPKIDVVVCPSREDCLPIVMTEAMMFGKICIASEGTGTADFITEGENGFVVPVEDVQALSKKMQWVLENKTQLEHIGKNARKTYEQYFSMEVFGDNLEKALLETEEFWKANKDL